MSTFPTWTPFKVNSPLHRCMTGKTHRRIFYVYSTAPESSIADLRDGKTKVDS